MAIQYFDAGRAMGNALAGAAAFNQIRERDQMRNFLAQNGDALMSGDSAALGAYAQYDPGGAFTMRRQMDADARAKAAEGRDVAEHKLRMQQAISAMSADERTQAAEEIANGLRGAAFFYSKGDEAGYNQFLTENEIDPAQFPFGQFPAHAAQFEDVLKALTTFDERNAGPEPSSAPGKVQADINAGLLPEGTPLQTPVTQIYTGDQVDPRPMADKPSKDYQRRYDAERGTWVDEPIPGSEAAVDAGRAGDAAKMASAAYQRKFELVDGKLSDAIAMLKDKGRWVAGYGAKLSALPESSARDFQSTLNTIKANLGFEELQAMRDASPTGGALGQVSEREIAFLQAMQGNLDASQSPEQLAKVLTEIQDGRRKFAAERERIMSGEPDYSPEAIMQMTERDIVNIPVEKMNAAQLDALEARWAQIKGQR